MKQVPLCFVLMSSRRQNDYEAVIRAVVDALLTPPAIQRVVMDFEAAEWLAFRACFPLVEIKGCLFHFSQVSI